MQRAPRQLHRGVRVKPGRYVIIGSLYVPTDWTPKPKRLKKIYGSSKDPDIPLQRSRVWIQILKARGEL